MGPRPIGRGNGGADCGRRARAGRLQWGRDQLVAEIMVPTILRLVRAVASMGPRPIGRGNHPRFADDITVRSASMGPRPIGRGNSAVYQTLAIENVASMGPRPIGRGNSLRPVLRSQTRRLQWGRDQLVAEISAWAPEAVAGRCFNGAATNWSRKFHHEVDGDGEPGAALQWGRDQLVAEI